MRRVVDFFIGIKLNGMQEMAYVTCDFTGLDNQYAGITKDFLINVSPSSLTYANANPIMFYSSETNTVKFDKNYRGYLYLSRMDGSIIETKSLESNIVEIHTRMKGMYILKVNLEGYGSIVRKIVI